MSPRDNAPSPGQADKKDSVRRMFDDIHGRYDLLNTVLSFGLDRQWRKITVRELPSRGVIIDLCSGGGELALELFKRPDFAGEVVLADISKPMLGLYESVFGPRYEGRYFPVVCDAENLPFKADALTGATCAFSLRNLTDLPRFSSEVLRVLKGRGAARYLEIAHPPNRLWGALFKFYFYRVSPLIARLFTKKTYAYRYLPRSLKAFPPQEDVTRLLCRGWSACRYRNIMGGVAALYELTKGEKSHAEY